MELPQPQPRKPRRRLLRAIAAFVFGLVAVPAAIHFSQPQNPGWQSHGDPLPPRAAETAGPQLADGYSNIHPGDYVGPERCGECHTKQYDLWRSHPHSRMNRDASETTVLGDFSGVTLRYGRIGASFGREGEHHVMTVRDGEGEERSFRVTRTVGSRFTQMYIGVQTAGPDGEVELADVERKLPFGYWLTRERWLPANYFDSDFLPDHDGGEVDAAFARLLRGNHWERNCIYCHNTYAYVERLRSGLPHMPGFPREQLRLASLVDAEGKALPTDELMRKRHLGHDSLVTLGVSCESCHFGGREHAAVEEVPPRFVPTAPDLSFPGASAELVEGSRESAFVINSICAQCHAAEGVSLYPNGAGTWNSREALDLFGGACSGHAKCTDCHEPHTPGPPGGGPDQAKQVAACVRCHEAYAEPEAAHSRHGEGVSCLDCHMPRVVQGLDAVIRSHRISSPTDERMLREASPNACNLCHLDRSIRWTASELSKGWRGVEAREQWAGAYGGLDRPLLEVWRGHEVPITRLVLTDALARWGKPELALPLLLDGLDDANAVNRMFASFAIEKVLGRPLTGAEYSPMAASPARRRQIARLKKTLTRKSRPR